MMMRPAITVVELSNMFAQRMDKPVLHSVEQQSNVASVNPCAKYINDMTNLLTIRVERAFRRLKPVRKIVAESPKMKFSKSMDRSFSVGHALPLPSGRILRFAGGCAHVAPAGNLSLRKRAASGCCANRCVTGASLLPEHCRTVYFTLHSPCV
jgi:hypothetical protein